MVRLTTSSHRNLLLFFNLLNEMFLSPAHCLCPLLPECVQRCSLLPGLHCSHQACFLAIFTEPLSFHYTNKYWNLISAFWKRAINFSLPHVYFIHILAMHPPSLPFKKKKVICYLCVTNTSCLSKSKGERYRDGLISSSKSKGERYRDDLISSRLSGDLMIVKRNRIDKEPLVPFAYIFTTVLAILPGY